MNNFTNHIFFISAEKHDRPGMVNRTNSLELFQRLQREFDSVKLVSGCYNGVIEDSYMVMVPFADVNRATGILQRFAGDYSQECIAYVDNERVLTLLYSDGKQERIGVLKENPDATDYYTEVNSKRYSAE